MTPGPHLSGRCPLVCCMQAGRGMGKEEVWEDCLTTRHKVRHHDGELHPVSLEPPLPLRRNRCLPLAAPGQGAPNSALVGTALAARNSRANLTPQLSSSGRQEVLKWVNSSVTSGLLVHPLSVCSGLALLVAGELLQPETRSWGAGGFPPKSSPQEPFLESHWPELGHVPSLNTRQERAGLQADPHRVHGTPCMSTVGALLEGQGQGWMFVQKSTEPPGFVDTSVFSHLHYF